MTLFFIYFGNVDGKIESLAPMRTSTLGLSFISVELVGGILERNRLCVNCCVFTYFNIAQTHKADHVREPARDPWLSLSPPLTSSKSDNQDFYVSSILSLNYWKVQSLVDNFNFKGSSIMLSSTDMNWPHGSLTIFNVSRNQTALFESHYYGPYDRLFNYADRRQLYLLPLSADSPQ
jgi:hypothetical protein